jgi:ADP-heptose:LPS heptosyltransferase
MESDPVASSNVERRLAAAGVTPGQPVIVVHVSAGNPFRRWPFAAFVDLACRLASTDPKRRIIFTSGPSDAAAATAIAEDARARLGTPQRQAILQCGEFDLAELKALVARAALYIGGDSGPLHIAGTTSVPVVGLYGPTLPVRSEPFRSARFISAAAEVSDLPCRPCNQRRCEPGDFRCLTGISAEMVAALAERALGLPEGQHYAGGADDGGTGNGDADDRSADLQVGPKDVHES